MRTPPDDDLHRAMTQLEAAFRRAIDEAKGSGAKPAGPPTLLTIEQACEALGISRNGIYSCFAKGVLRSVHAGRRRLVPASAVEAFIEQGGAP